MLTNIIIKQQISQPNIQIQQTLTNIANTACGSPFYCHDMLLTERAAYCFGRKE